LPIGTAISATRAIILASHAPRTTAPVVVADDPAVQSMLSTVVPLNTSATQTPITAPQIPSAGVGATAAPMPMPSTATTPTRRSMSRSARRKTPRTGSSAARGPISIRSGSGWSSSRPSRSRPSWPRSFSSGSIASGSTPSVPAPSVPAPADPAPCSLCPSGSTSSGIPSGRRSSVVISGSRGGGRTGGPPRPQGEHGGEHRTDPQDPQRRRGRPDDQSGGTEREQRGPQVHDDDRPPVRVPELQQPVVQVPPVGLERRPARTEPAEHRQPHVQQRQHHHRDREHDRQVRRDLLARRH